MDKGAMAKGREFEEEFTREINGDAKPGSGNQWYARGDVGGQGITFSLKYTRNKTFDLSHSDFDEIVEICEGIGGDGNIPAMAVRVGDQGHDFIVMRKADFLRAFREEMKFVKPEQGKGAQRRHNASVSILDRD